MEKLKGVIKEIGIETSLSSGARIMNVDMELNPGNVVNLTLMGGVIDSLTNLKLPVEAEIDFEFQGKLSSQNGKARPVNKLRVFYLIENNNPGAANFNPIIGKIHELGIVRTTSIGGRFQDLVIERIGCNAVYAKTLITLEGKLVDQIKNCKVDDQVKIEWKLKGSEFTIDNKRLISNKIIALTIEPISENSLQDFKIPTE